MNKIKVTTTPLVLLLAIVLTLSGCMPIDIVPMGGRDRMGHHDEMMPKRSADDTESIMFQIVDHMIEELIADLLRQDIDISTVAVWGLRAESGERYRQTIRQKLITELIASQSFQVVSRDRLQELLEEKGLAEIGAIDAKNAVEIGPLIGVDGFIDGYIFLGKEHYVLSLSLIDASNGIITWAKSTEWTVR